ncbi:hypothetical protein DMC64_41825 [Amycolatopsis sp. WAC 04197]|uniref:hypothetical protein n=1 Tax=Amycolatopsis sp. WAC 04197 TaxID=2203199 RepID=UPI000F79C959|nr:hypothetical protein [Amycolatopsis sp. WAC 04197]RSN38608.1 hypothetical protein DMC64_41825 [Amycolatopsis sp. WAC 04197]
MTGDRDFPHPLGNIRPAPQPARTEAELLAALGLSTDVPANGLSQMCDFCERSKDQRPPRWYYPVKSTVTMNFGGIDVPVDAGILTGPGWVACDHCHAFIARGDFAGLAEELGYAQLEYSGVDQFRKIMLGPGQPLAEGKRGPS